ncbi:hypothetical protein ACIP6V_23685 [Streptomyces sp. NPDC088770]|uniref:hypothetical protein n=1 Tax=Streptomyces sp. NPDC088770 TaxID=3365895 RepID=UPI00380598D4
MNSGMPRLFILRRDQDVTGVSGPGDVADGVQWPDGTVALRWRDRPSTSVWDSLKLMLSVHGHDGATKAVFSDTDDRARAAAGRAYLLADRWEAAHGQSAFLVRAAGAELREELDGADECDHRLLPMPSGLVPGGPCVVRGPHDEHETSDGTKFSMVAATGPEPTGIRGLLEHVGLDTRGRDITVDGRMVHAANLREPAAECAAQHHGFDDGRLCIRAAQHRGDHIDERGYHWSDTVAVYPLADGTLRESPAAAVRRGQEYVSARYRSEPEPQHDRPASSCSNPDHACTKCGECAYEHPGEDGCSVGQLPPAEGRSVRTACTGQAEKRSEELRAESLCRGKEDLPKAERIRALETAVAELARALRLTREYVGEDVLPAVEGWSWYDALRRHAPHELAAADEAYAGTFAGQLASLKKKIADALAEGLAETVQRAAQAEATIKRVRAMAEAWERMPQGRYVYIHEAARGVRIALAGAEQPATAPICRDCPHCPDGHQPPTSGSQPWGVWVGPARDGDGQPTTIHVARSAGAHVAETDAEWMRHVLNHQPDPETLCRLPHETEG